MSLHYPCCNLETRFSVPHRGIGRFTIKGFYPLYVYPLNQKTFNYLIIVVFVAHRRYIIDDIDHCEEHSSVSDTHDAQLQQAPTRLSDCIKVT